MLRYSLKALGSIPSVQEVLERHSVQGALVRLSVQEAPERHSDRYYIRIQASLAQRFPHI